MSSAPLPPSTNPSPPTAAPAPRPLARGPESGRRDEEIVVYSHSTLFYWWPIWLLGFFCAGYTYFNNMHLALVPAGTEAVEQRVVQINEGGKQETRDVLILPGNKNLREQKNLEGELEAVQPIIYMTAHRSVGTIFALVLLIVISFTNISVRGLWAVFVILVIIMLSIIFLVAGWWGPIFRNLGQLSVYINMGGYLVLSTVLFILWLANFIFFDRQTYMVFTPGQMRVRLLIGGEETAYDTAGMVVQKQRNDLFRHWILGFGSGDLIVRPVGLSYPLDLPNVLSISRIVRQVEQLTKEKVVIEKQ